ncbi:target of Nesh-SH3-like isoform 1 [Cricetulus griseus]|uniref:Target of Nesh-SH3-like isoform 1 n=1 Tax=Cricetulus griseus TaxID=10029 RepID=A0A061I7I3_CRIGR|nr:target of Nesh-SH3-like isoform 1 [Cricetulus griseus]
MVMLRAHDGCSIFNNSGTMIQNVTHKASTKAPDKTPFGGTILVHLIIPGLNDSMVKLPTSIMLEISDALKAQLDKNETLALPVESKTPEVEKVAAQPVTVLSEKTPETAHSVLIPEFELPLSTLAPKRFPEFPKTKTTAFPLEKPGDILVSSEEQWVSPGAKTSEDSKFVQPQTAPSEASFDPQNVKIFTSPEVQPTTTGN